ncbi:inositol monophosphatase family protein [Blastococcus goldschmidtiae]|uniref:Inositol monophosphatase family protein n=1 Tax=Blastococcus goldschmidtiae TaxID=3075546 RepID=A0ABU2K6F5_9ACTN|nr:inositol monophosphatase family protein [Blastococcus sp. DSM 46792]MDT0275765.1 inositol monophosphatase family protein [Blastococcus sp. DSM 46792]
MTRATHALRTATGADLTAVGEALGLSAPALAPAMVEPGARVLVGTEGQVVLLRRHWSHDATAEAVVVRRAGVPLDHPGVLAAAAGWGCDRVRHLATDRCVPVPTPPDGAPLALRFAHLAALAATRVETAVALARDVGRHTTDDGGPEAPAEEAAHAAAVGVLGALGVPVLGEASGDRPVAGGEPWIVIHPLDGVGNYRAGLPPWAFSAALVHDGRPVAGLVVDLSCGRRWSAIEGRAERDGVPVRTRAGGTVVVPSAPDGGAIGAARRVRITGCTAVDLCLVADGAVAAWHDVDRTGTEVRDVAGGLAVLLAAGGAALTADGRPVELVPHTGEKVRFVAAADETVARTLLDAVA